MPRKGNVIPKAPLSRILTNCGAKRISDEALEVFSDNILKFAEDISKHAIDIARHAGRKTVHESDIKLANK